MSKKEKSVKKTGRITNARTGFTVGTLGDKVGLAYLAAKTREEAVISVTKLIVESFKSKGKSTAQELTRKRAVILISRHLKHLPNIYKPLPMAENKVKTLTKKGARVPLVSQKKCRGKKRSHHKKAQTPASTPTREAVAA